MDNECLLQQHLLLQKVHKKYIYDTCILKIKVELKETYLDQYKSLAM